MIRFRYWLADLISGGELTRLRSTRTVTIYGSGSGGGGGTGLNPDSRMVRMAEEALK